MSVNLSVGSDFQRTDLIMQTCNVINIDASRT